MLAEIRPYVYATENRELIKLWRKLTISDHFYYMATRFGSVGGYTRTSHHTRTPR